MARSPAIAPAAEAVACRDGPDCDPWAWTSSGAPGSAPLHSLTATNNLLLVAVLNGKEVRPPATFFEYQIEVPPENSLSSIFVQPAGALGCPPATPCSCTVATSRSPALVPAGRVTVTGVVPVALALWTRLKGDAAVPLCSILTSS